MINLFKKHFPSKCCTEDARALNEKQFQKQRATKVKTINYFYHSTIKSELFYCCRYCFSIMMHCRGVIGEMYTICTKLIYKSLSTDALIITLNKQKKTCFSTCQYLLEPSFIHLWFCKI